MSKPSTLLIEILGWYGVGAVLLAYGLTNFDVISTKHLIYPVLNLSGALCIGVSAYKKHDYQPFALNLVWAGIALIALFSYFSL